MALVYQHERGPSVRGTMSSIFVAGTIIAIAGLWWAGRFGLVELALGAILTPAVMLGFAISRYTAVWLDRRHIRPGDPHRLRRVGPGDPGPSALPTNLTTTDTTDTTKNQSTIRLTPSFNSETLKLSSRPRRWFASLR